MKKIFLAQLGTNNDRVMFQFFRFNGTLEMDIHMYGTKVQTVYLDKEQAKHLGLFLTAQAFNLDENHHGCNHGETHV